MHPYMGLFSIYQTIQSFETNMDGPTLQLVKNGVKKKKKRKRIEKKTRYFQTNSFTISLQTSLEDGRAGPKGVQGGRPH